MRLSLTRSRYGADVAEELVVLLDDGGEPIGTAPKSTVHDADTPLHLAFSCHVFDPMGRVLVTRRALTKIAWPGVWTNAVCGHPGPGEPIAEAIARRASQELGIGLESLEVVLPDFRYRAVDAAGVVENEVCPVYRAVTRDEVRPALEEVAEWLWADPHALHQAVAAAPFAFSPWLVLQLDAWDRD